LAHAEMAVGARGTDAWGWPLAHDGLRSGVLGSLRIAGWPVAHDGWGGREWPFAHDYPWRGEGGRLRTTLYQGPVAMIGRLDREGGRSRTMGAGLRVAVCARGGTSAGFSAVPLHGWPFAHGGSAGEGGRLRTLRPGVALCAREGGRLRTMAQDGPRPGDSVREGD